MGDSVRLEKLERALRQIKLYAYDWSRRYKPVRGEFEDIVRCCNDALAYDDDAHATPSGSDRRSSSMAADAHDLAGAIGKLAVYDLKVRKLVRAWREAATIRPVLKDEQSMVRYLARREALERCANELASTCLTSNDVAASVQTEG